MHCVLDRRQALCGLGAATLASWAWEHSARGGETLRHGDSPYRLEFTYTLEELVGDLLHGERGDPRRESETPHHEWYSHHVRKHLGAWGPNQRRYEPLPGLAERPVAWKRERAIATGARFLGYGYQHHHIPDWDPPRGWPWKHCCMGHNGRGVDCSNFTTFVYNQGFGIHMSSGIGQQSRTETALEGHHGVRVSQIELPADHDERADALRTGDLLYIRGREGGPITHVVMWVGAIGHSPSGAPLVMDSHGPDVVDDNGRHIPCGIQLRPFRKGSWYDRCASHAHRIFHDSEA